MKQNENGQSAAKRRWAIIKEAPEYMVSTFGEVKRIKTGRILAFGSRKRYYTVTLFINGKPLYRYVHRLVALAFIPKDDETKNYVNHKDHDIHNNNVENLEWCTSSENARHSYEKGRREKEYQTVKSFIQPLMVEATKRPVNQFDKKHNFIATFDSIRKAELITGEKLVIFQEFFMDEEKLLEDLSGNIVKVQRLSAKENPLRQRRTLKQEMI